MSLTDFIALVALPVALGALAWCYVLNRRLAAATRRSSDLADLAAGGDVAGLADVVGARLASLEEADGNRRADDEALAARLAKAVRHVGLVRYDAFDHTAGEQSFSLAMLDDSGDGFIMTSIYGRGEYRMYAKPVAAAQSPYSLTVEEAAAIRDAGISPEGAR